MPTESEASRASADFKAHLRMAVKSLNICVTEGRVGELGKAITECRLSESHFNSAQEELDVVKRWLSQKRVA